MLLALAVAAGWCQPVSGVAKHGVPPHADYCAMLERDIEGAHHGFLAGNRLYYVAGLSAAEWDHMIEAETLGFTHPMFRDGRARGTGIVDDPDTGTGHDAWGWDFYRHVRGAYGTLMVDGKTYRHPRADRTCWRPDRQIGHYNVGGARITEEKFISRNDVLTDIISVDRDVILLFEGASFVSQWDVPDDQSNGEASGKPMSQGVYSTAVHLPEDNAFRVIEEGKTYAKPRYRRPPTIGKTMYSGLRFVLTSDAKLLEPRVERDPDRGNVRFSFRLNVPAGKPVTLVYAVSEDYPEALSRARAVLEDPYRHMTEKTAYMNTLLNEQIPYFRCSDEAAVMTYYYLWSLYFMYFRDIGEGYLRYPHTQTAINNFMGLHLWDSWAYTQAGSWVADKWSFGHGNVLSWQFMVPFKNEANQLPDNFGTSWQSVDAYMGFVGAVEPAWQQYRRSGDRDYLEEVYTRLFKPLYRDHGGPTRTFGIEVNAINTLQNMARTLGRADDIPLWEAFRKANTEAFAAEWSAEWPGFYGPRNTPWKDIWALVALQSDLMPREWGRRMIDEHVVDTEVGFMSPVGLNTRAADSPPNGIFRCSTISLWLAVDGMFRQGRPYPAMLATVNHIKAMTREWGYPVAPEAWEENHRSWGSHYYNWDVALVCPMLEWLAGVDYSIPDGTFTVAPNLPPSWDYIETYTPVVLSNRTHWVRSSVHRQETADPEGYRLAVTVDGSPLAQNRIRISREDREVVEVDGALEERGDDGVLRFLPQPGAVRASAVLGRKKTSPYKTLAWVTPRTRIFHGTTRVRAENLTPGTELRYTLNGREPTPASPLFPKDGIKMDGTSDLLFKAFGNDGAIYLPFKLRFEKTDLLPAAPVNHADSEAGLDYTAYAIPPKSTAIPDFDGLQVIGKGHLGPEALDGEIQIGAIQKAIGREEDFALHLTGYLHVPEDQVYNLHVASDDGSRLFIDGVNVIDLNSSSDYDPWFKEGYVGLRQGLHAIDIHYYQAHYRTKLHYQMRPGDEQLRKAIPAEAWRRRAVRSSHAGGREP
jgi:hypothetical protein